MRFHPGHSKIDDQALAEKAHLGVVDLLDSDIVRPVKGGPNLAKVVRIKDSYVLLNTGKRTVTLRLLPESIKVSP